MKDYREHYEQALERAKHYLSELELGDTARCVFEEIFPELKESEDERIRKSLIKSYTNQHSANFPTVDGFTREQILAWLEKQGSCPCWNNAHDIRPKHLQRCICYDKHMNSVYCYVYDDISKYWCTQMTKEHDPNGDNHVCDYADYRVTVWMPLPDTPLNVCDKVEPKFEIEKGWIYGKTVKN